MTDTVLASSTSVQQAEATLQSIRDCGFHEFLKQVLQEVSVRQPADPFKYVAKRLRQEALRLELKDELEQLQAEEAEREAQRRLEIEKELQRRKEVKQEAQENARRLAERQRQAKAVKKGDKPESQAGRAEADHGREVGEPLAENLGASSHSDQSLVNQSDKGELPLSEKNEQHPNAEVENDEKSTGVPIPSRGQDKHDQDGKQGTEERTILNDMVKGGSGESGEDGSSESAEDESSESGEDESSESGEDESSESGEDESSESGEDESSESEEDGSSESKDSETSESESGESEEEAPAEITDESVQEEQKAGEEQVAQDTNEDDYEAEEPVVVCEVESDGSENVDDDNPDDTGSFADDDDFAQGVDAKGTEAPVEEEEAKEVESEEESAESEGSGESEESEESAESEEESVDEDGESVESEEESVDEEPVEEEES